MTREQDDRFFELEQKYELSSLEVIEFQDLLDKYYGQKLKLFLNKKEELVGN